MPTLMYFWDIGRRSGLTIAEIDSMTAGMVMDNVFTWLNSQHDASEVATRPTQEYFDNF